jgi:hypothetical protein
MRHSQRSLLRRLGWGNGCGEGARALLKSRPLDVVDEDLPLPPQAQGRRGAAEDFCEGALDGLVSACGLCVAGGVGVLSLGRRCLFLVVLGPGRWALELIPRFV